MPAPHRSSYDTVYTYPYNEPLLQHMHASDKQQQQSHGGDGRVSPTARMGWQKSQRAYVPLHCVYPEGGTLPCTLLLVQRKYPVMMHELLPSGVPITRSQQAYQTAQNQFEVQAANVSPLGTRTPHYVPYSNCTVWGVEPVVTDHTSWLF